ncbi:MAG TPA: hypothetical protein VF345_08890 [Chthoniobacterales bacterium]
MKTTLVLLLTASFLAAAEPKRDGGLSVHMLPDRVAKLDGKHGGFTVSDPSAKEGNITYPTPEELVAYFQRLSESVRANGIWIVTTHPDSYSEGEQTKLKALIALCAEKKIPVYTCRASELPNGWTRAK